MKATITYKSGNSIMTMEVENVTKIEKTYGMYNGKSVEELRVYDSDYHWRTWIAEGIINIFIHA